MENDEQNSSKPLNGSPMESKSKSNVRSSPEHDDDLPRKRVKLENDSNTAVEAKPSMDRQKGVAPIKKEYLINVNEMAKPEQLADDDAAEASGKTYEQTTAGRGGQKTKGGQNHARQFGSSRDAIQLCKSRSTANEFDDQTCRFGKNCKFEHDIRVYLKDGKREDLATFNGTCPIWEIKGNCSAGWRCRFAGSHSKEIEREDKRMELTQVVKDEVPSNGVSKENEEEESVGVTNVVSVGDKIRLRKRQVPMTKSDKYLEYLNQPLDEKDRKQDSERDAKPANDTNGLHEDRAAFKEPPLRPSEKRRIYYGPETPVLAPLTTQGNLPFRRLCVSLGAQVTWSEMAMGFPLIQGEKQEWALMKAHESELQPPRHTPQSVVEGYDNSKDLKFGAQIAANKPYLALKTTEVLTTLCPHLRAIDLNCGCPIDLVFRQGSGSALLDAQSKLEKILRGMNVVSGEVPITVKIRMGTKDKQPNAEKLCRRLIMGGEEAQQSNEGPAGVAAITLHGRSRQQRYTRSADWEYISDCANLVRRLKTQRAEVTDTVREPDARDVSSSVKSDGLPYFCGNGDILSHVDYNEHMEQANVDSIMIARGALIKPWIFEEIALNQYLDKSASERLGYIEQFVRNGLEHWGSDEVGVGTTRRFLLEWLSFSCRYVPIGILEHLPPKFGDRPPAFRGRSDLETLLSSANYKDWIKIRYVA
jgi:tRNA-dihydrouridine synthase 3